MQLKWYHQFQFAGYYAAQAQGYYRDAGVDVQIREGGPGKPPLGSVLAGTAQFGVTDSDVVQARMRGQPLVVCAVVFQHSPYVLLTRRDRSIRTPADLVGKRVMLSDDQGAAQFRAMLIHEGIDPSRVEIVPHSWNLDDLAQDRIDALSAYATVEPFLLAARGVDCAYLRSIDYGVDFYGDVLFTTEEQARQNPRLVQAVVEASLRGWSYALSHPEQVAEQILRMPGVRERGITRQQLLAEAAAMRDFILPDVVELGHINPGRWQRIAQIFAETGLAPRQFDLQGFVFEPDTHVDPRLLAWLRAAAIVILAASIGAGIWTAQMRRAVRARTAELREENHQRSLAEERYRASEERLNRVFVQAANGIVAMRPDGTISRANPAFLDSLKLPGESALGGWLDLVHAEDRAEVARVLARLAASSAENCVLESRYRRSDDSVAWLRCSFSLVTSADGQPLELIAITEDVSARVAAQRDAEILNAKIAEQADLLNKTSDAILVCDLEGRVRYWNTGAERIFGWKAEEAVGRPLEAVGVADPAQPELRARVIASGAWVGDLTHQARDGRRLTVNARWSLVRDDDNAPESILMICTDVTEARAVQSQLLRAQRMESIGRLAGGIAHDLNNVLAPILMGVEILQEQLSAARDLSLLATMRTSAQRGAALVRQVLTYARGVEGERIPLSPRLLALEIESFMRDTFPKNISLVLDVPADIWAIEGDPTQIHQVLINLCVNARDAMPDGGRLRIGAENRVLTADTVRANGGTGGAGSYVVLTIQDTGGGIPPSVREHIFEPFFTTKGVGRGTGLGLSTALSIVRSHRGFMRVDCPPAGGTCFEVFIPSTKATAAIAAPTADAPRHPTADGAKVLVVDDEADVRAAAVHILRAHGYEVLEAADGEEALQVVAAHADLAAVLTDLMMPRLDGRALIDQLRRMPRRLPVVAMTGVVMDDRGFDPATLPVAAWLRKPFSSDELLEAMSQARSQGKAQA
ncbi:ABC transporter substrate-binding protein [Oleiharenicola sp. Vm1]|uniref:ABC transporter substrate-binding protein n=1 Tax=Oleiharenicola sp. Vm1 TaxID=3398393 RepID=UPI0039F57F31